MKLRFPESKIQQWAEHYKPTGDKARWENELIEIIKPKVKQHGYLELNELETLVKWKSERRKALVKDNCDSDVKHITKCAFLVRGKRPRIEILTCLRGVAYPIASAILHFFHEDPYPILDVRALWSVGFEEEEINRLSYSFKFWKEYMRFCRNVASRNGIKDMRTLDRALWQYSIVCPTRLNSGRSTCVFAGMLHPATVSKICEPWIGHYGSIQRKTNRYHNFREYAIMPVCRNSTSNPVTKQSATTTPHWTNTHNKASHTKGPSVHPLIPSSMPAQNR